MRKSFSLLKEQQKEPSASEKKRLIWCLQTVAMLSSLSRCGYFETKMPELKKKKKPKGGSVLCFFFGLWSLGFLFA